MAELSDPAFSQGDIMRRLATLERTVRELSAGRRLEAATVGAGGITVKGGNIRIMDADGATLVAQVGKLPDNTYGVAALDSSSVLVSLATLAFGMRSDQVDATEGTVETSMDDLTTVGPTLTDVTIGNSGRCLLFLSSLILIGVGGYDGYMGFELSGANTLAASDLRSLGFAVPGPTGLDTSRLFTLTGLNPGVTTIKAKYMSGDGTEVQFARRNLTALPY